MFRRGRGLRFLRFWLRGILRYELVLVVALFAIPFLFAPIISVSDLDYANSLPNCSYGYGAENDACKISVWERTFGGFHEFVGTFHDDIDALSTAIIALFTVILAWSTVKLWRETERLAEGAADQSDKMANSLKEAARAATAMEDVARSLDVTAKSSVVTIETVSKQSRAYLTIGAGSFWAQDSATGFRFQMDVTVVNVGFTPARNVVSSFTADVLPFPLPDEFDLRLPEPPHIAGSTINPRHPYTFSAIAARIVPEDLMWKSIKTGEGFALYVWGTFWYDDVVTAERRFQNYCQRALWRGAGDAVWTNLHRHNDGN